MPFLCIIDSYVEFLGGSMRGVYALYWEDRGLVYIGQGNLNTRYYSHLNDLKNNKHCNYKVQNAYDMYGVPQFVVLETNCGNLALSEMRWIQEFDCVRTGLNILPGGLQLAGINHPRSKFSRKTILKVLVLLWKTKMTYKSISYRLGVSISSIRDISNGRIHAWLSEEFTEAYNNMVQLRGIQKYSDITKKNYPKLVDPTGVVHSITNIAQFCRNHPLLSNNWECNKTELGRLFKGSRMQHKGFKLL